VHAVCGLWRCISDTSLPLPFTFIVLSERNRFQQECECCCCEVTGRVRWTVPCDSHWQKPDSRIHAVVRRNPEFRCAPATRPGCSRENWPQYECPEFTLRGCVHAECRPKKLIYARVKAGTHYPYVRKKALHAMLFARTARAYGWCVRDDAHLCRP